MKSATTQLEILEKQNLQVENQMCFYMPEVTGGKNKSVSLNESCQVVKSLYKNSGDSVYSGEFLKLIAIVMHENALNVPTNIIDAKLLYLKLAEKIERYL